MTTDAPIVTPDDLANFEAGDDSTLIAQATAAVRGLCGWHVTPSITETVTLPAPYSAVLGLPSLYVTDVASVTVDGAALDAATAYTWSTPGLVVRGLYPYRFTSAVTVTYTHGYDSAPDLAAVILARVSRMKANPKAVTRQQAGPFMEQYEAGVGFTADELDVLNRYRIPSAT